MRQSDSGREVVETVVFVVVLVLLLKSFAAEAFVIPTGSMAVTLWGYQKVAECPKCHHKAPVNCADEVDPQDGKKKSVNSYICENCRQASTFTRDEERAGNTVVHIQGDMPDPGCNSGDRVLVAKFLDNGPLAAAPYLGRQALIFLALAGSALAGGLIAGLLLRLLLRRFQELARRPAIAYPVRLLGAVVLATVVGVVLLSGGPAWAASQPNRLDVVVFKYPQEPQKNFTPMNYIKRLIGLPGETLAIYGGKVYILSAAESPKYVEQGVDAKDLWKLPYTHSRMALGGKYSEPPEDSSSDRWAEYKGQDLVGIELFRQGKFHILQKPPAQVLALRRIVYDNDHPASDLVNHAGFVRWTPDTNANSWATLDADNGFRHSARQGSTGDSWLRYHHILRPQRDDAGRAEPELITDFMSYNSANGGSQAGLNWASDLLLEVEVTVEDPAGGLVLELSRGNDRYQARWDLTSGKCTLMQITRESGKASEVTLEANVATALQGKGTHVVRFADFDDRLTVWVDSTLPFGDGKNCVVPSDPRTRIPNRTNDLEPASVGASGGANVVLKKLKLWRDTYYTVKPGVSDYNLADDKSVEWGNPSTWPKYKDQLPLRTMYVQPGHYLCLGDNSPASSDSRQWGLVPERLMLGRALMIYYPFGLFGPSNRAGRIE